MPLAASLGGAGVPPAVFLRVMFKFKEKTAGGTPAPPVEIPSWK